MGGEKREKKLQGSVPLGRSGIGWTGHCVD